MPYRSVFWIIDIIVYLSGFCLPKMICLPEIDKRTDSNNDRVRMPLIQENIYNLEYKLKVFLQKSRQKSPTYYWFFRCLFLIYTFTLDRFTSLNISVWYDKSIPYCINHTNFLIISALLISCSDNYLLFWLFVPVRINSQLVVSLFQRRLIEHSLNCCYQMKKENTM